MHLDDKYLFMVKQILAEYASQYEVWAFGSQVHGQNLKKFSDLDLVIINEKPLEWQELGALKDAFSESDLPIMVDVVDWASTNENFRGIIKKDYEVIQEKRENI